MQYSAPQSVDQAVALLAAGVAARPLAGGTDLLVQVKTGRIAPERVVDLKKIPELRRIEASAAGFRIGAAVSGLTVAGIVAVAVVGRRRRRRVPMPS